MKWHVITCVCVLFFFASHTLVAQKNKPTHATWTHELNRFVTMDGLVKYAEWHEDQKALDDYLTLLSTYADISDLSESEQLAYWINAYNAFTVKLVLMHYPIRSIRDIREGKPWDYKWIQLGRDTYSLNEIENNIIRVQFQDPRIHFALNCAARGCPPLRSEAYEASKLKAQLDDQASHFINSKRFNIITPDKIHLSEIFKWYQSDFGNDLIEYINQYASEKISPSATIIFIPYAWSLNEAK